MKIVGCDLHARQQTIAMVDTETGEFTEKTLCHEGNAVREFYAALEGPVVVGIEATGAMQWFLEVLEELGIECRVGHPAKIRAAETRKQKHDRRNARLVLDLLVMEDRFPQIWMPSTEQRDLRTLLRDRHQWVDANALAAHAAGDCTQSRPAPRPRTVECGGAERTAGLASATLHQSETNGSRLFLHSHDGSTALADHRWQLIFAARSRCCVTLKRKNANGKKGKGVTPNR